MNNNYPRLAIRITDSNPNHHLWNNHGTWWIDYTIHPNAMQKERVRVSLETTSLAEARVRRDAIFADFELERAA